MPHKLKLRTSFSLRTANTGTALLLSAMMGLVGLVALIVVTTSLAVAGTLAVLCVVLGVGASQASNEPTPNARGLVIAERAGLQLGGESLKRSAIKAGYFVPGSGEGSPHVLLSGVAGQLARIDVADAAEGEALLEALGLGPGKRLVRFAAVPALGTRAGAGAALAMVAAVGLFVASFPLALGWLAAMGTAAGLAGMFLWDASVDVGADGLLLKSRVGSRFLPWSRVRKVERSRSGIRVTLERAGGADAPDEVVSVPLGARGRHEKGALLAHARDALAAFHRGDGATATARLTRGGRTADDWLRSLFDAEGDFRRAPLVDEHLWPVVESAAAPVTARAAAAAVLARRGGVGTKDRLRIAAGACAEPRLRVVLDRASAPAAADVEDALRSLEDEAEGADLRARSERSGSS